MTTQSVLDPGDLLMVQERERALARVFQRQGYRTLQDARVFEAGCGGGYNLRQMVQWGADPEHVRGMDVAEERVAYARMHSPGLQIHLGSAEQVPEGDRAFDISLAFTLFSSIHDEGVAERIAMELFRITRPGGLILVYDMRRKSPGNRSVHPIERDDIQRWFPKCRVKTRHLTLAPPIARKGRFAPFLYGPLASIPPLRTHSLHVMRRPAMSPFDEENPDVSKAGVASK
ncbi:MAG: class I SAM-dependent methyltransferase [Dehalococcoidia bacterium]|nr:class I SAM-dependent methyltransferase [Dehalococcoidia bacterium]